MITTRAPDGANNNNNNNNDNNDSAFKVSELYILDIRQEDEGIYYCRLTFQNQHI